eukprot:CAMPEP_0169180838 /NCGR_PEP_ID=MMETSP1015-20121227/68385_1 /TAXON_ID=342587 /ORGANISM="Karlodinium micrum, Strain CCMP2283" /LENGTH=223 /DNA_ID=CAMNT_0009255975 /DNA_START=37 /DNA_END=705 /DNA_ORIENTATION=-
MASDGECGLHQSRHQTVLLLGCVGVLPLAGECDNSDPAEFRIYAGIFTVVRFERLPSSSCYIGKECLVILELAPYNTPVVSSDLIIVKTGSQPTRRIASRDDPDVCNGNVVTGLGPLADGLSARMRVGIDTRPEATTTDPVGIFNMSIAYSAVGIYRLCWCQASIRPCVKPEEFVVDVGQIQVNDAAYVWPACTATEPNFVTWRSWTTFDDCCCNYYEAGAVG